MKEIPLTKGQTALVDDDDYDRLSSLSWYARWSGNNWYAMTGRHDPETWKTQQLHMTRLILDVPPDMVVDHINRISLDNRKENLRICTQSENLANRRPYGASGRKGLHTDKRRGTWYVRIWDRINKVYSINKSFPSREEAEVWMDLQNLD